MENQNDHNLDQHELPEASTEQSDVITISKSKLAVAKKIIANLKDNLEQLNSLFSGADLPGVEHYIRMGQAIDEAVKGVAHHDNSDKIIEGVFDGEAMIGPDGKRYNVSANYASKSKLVEGDILKLSITSSGTFVYKQISPIERIRVIGTLKRVGENDFLVINDHKSWKVLNASVTYFKGDEGDETIILVPKNSESKWAAVENIVKLA